MRETINILEVPIDKVTMAEAAKKIEKFVASNTFHSVFTPNPEIVMLAQEKKELKTILQKADLVVPDGIGVVIASKILKGEPLPERVPGYDLIQKSMSQATKKGYKYYFFGGKPEIARQAAEKMREKYKGIQIVGVHDGYFKEEDIPDIIEDINRSGANILLVALGAPKQELWINQYKKALTSIKVAIGVGGSLDGMAGVVKRAPEIYQKLGLEWFYRLVKQPTRAKRMFVLPQFIFRVIAQRNKKQK